MKLRLKGNEGNSLRLRLSRSEMERLLRGQEIAEEVCFAAAGAGTFRYALMGSDSGTEVAVTCGPGTVSIAVPMQQVQTWSTESQVGIYETITIDAATKLELVLEKDFACLDRADADNADTFEHPSAGSVC